MKGLILVAIACVLTTACNKDEETKPPVMTNPGGKTANLSPAEASRASEYEQAGARANAAMEEASRKMREAQGGNH